MNRWLWCGYRNYCLKPYVPLQRPSNFRCIGTPFHQVYSPELSDLSGIISCLPEREFVLTVDSANGLWRSLHIMPDYQDQFGDIGDVLGARTHGDDRGFLSVDHRYVTIIAWMFSSMMLPSIRSRSILGISRSHAANAELRLLLRSLIDLVVATLLNELIIIFLLIAIELS